MRLPTSCIEWNLNLVDSYHNNEALASEVTGGKHDSLQIWVFETLLRCGVHATVTSLCLPPDNFKTLFHFEEQI